MAPSQTPAAAAVPVRAVSVSVVQNKQTTAQELRGCGILGLGWAGHVHRGCDEVNAGRDFRWQRVGLRSLDREASGGVSQSVVLGLHTTPQHTTDTADADSHPITTTEKQERREEAAEVTFLSGRCRRCNARISDDRNNLFPTAKRCTRTNQPGAAPPRRRRRQSR